jgi:hypothetical protein
MVKSLRLPQISASQFSGSHSLPVGARTLLEETFRDCIQSSLKSCYPYNYLLSLLFSQSFSKLYDKDLLKVSVETLAFTKCFKLTGSYSNPFSFLSFFFFS